MTMSLNTQILIAAILGVAFGFLLNQFPDTQFLDGSIYTLSIVFHLLVIIQIIPSSIVWGGRLTNQQELFIFESISIVLNVLSNTFFNNSGFFKLK